MRRNHYCFCYRTPLLLVVATSSRFQAFTVPPPSSSPSSLTSSTAPCCTQQHTSRRKFTTSCTSLLYTTSSGDSSSDRINRSVYSSSGQSSAKPHWIPMELVELASEDLQLTQDEFIQSYVDVEAYTSCDDEGDDFHECDFFQQYLGPTKWVHLTPDATIHEAHLDIWKDVWSHPHEAIDVADKVSKECLRYCKEFMIESRVSSDEYPNDNNNTNNPPIIRIKVIPASFGLDGFEETVWEAAESMMMKRLADTYTHGQPQHGASMPSPTNQTCQAMITLVVAAPDLFTDPILLDGISPQAEFESDRFRVFSSNLSEKLALVTKGEGAVVLNDDIHFTTYHPLWRMSEPSERRSTISEKQFPYPCVAISMKVGGIEGEL